MYKYIGRFKSTYILIFLKKYDIIYIGSDKNEIYNCGWP